MLKLRMVRGLGVLVLAGGALMGPARHASAVPADPGCDSYSNTSTWDGWDWLANGNNTLSGIRAPVKLRSDGLLCTNSHNDSTSSVWIAITFSDGSFGVQIGFIHEFVNGIGMWCRFFEHTGIAPDAYTCTDDDGTQVYFEITQSCTQAGCSYSLYDCGTGGDFTDCGQPKDTATSSCCSTEAVVSSEAHYWCLVRMMGQGSDRVWYGNSSWATSIEDSTGWSKNRNWFTYGVNQCTSQYQSDNAGGGLLRTWDSRNTS